MEFCCWMKNKDPNRPVAAVAQSPTENPGEDYRHGIPPVQGMNKRDEVLHAYKFYSFNYSVLRAATQKFGHKNLIGRGDFGDVYKGWIDYCNMSAAKPNKGVAVAVKKLLSLSLKYGTQGQTQWMNELTFLSRLNHPNIVKLIGYCCEGEHRILVYEFMTKGSLEAYLLREGDTELNWSRRIKIAIGTARGLDYIHTAGRPVISRDMKASNILLDTDFNAKLSDFGLAKFRPQDEKSHMCTGVVGTRYCLAPEYRATGQLTLKTDVYSFGGLLLEIFCGSNAVKKYTDAAAGNLAEWAEPYLSNEQILYHVIDKKLGRNFRIEEARGFAEIILRCINSDPKRRPTMTEVLAALEKLEQNKDICCMQNTLRIAKYPIIS